MRIGDARAMPIDHEDVIAVTPTSVYYREKKNRTTFSLYRLDEEDGLITQLNRGSTRITVIPSHSSTYKADTEEVVTTFEKRWNSTFFRVCWLVE